MTKENGAAAMTASGTARALARANLVAAIKQAARDQIAVEGAARLSVRAVAREVGMVSSAVYRYFPTRDDLLTALIIDAYDALGTAVEQAAGVAGPGEVRVRWRSVCRAVRVWARAHPQEYGLIFGSPVPGYRAPQDTVAPAARVPAALLAVVRDGWSAGAVDVPPASAEERGQLAGQLAVVADALAPGVPPALVLGLAVAWTQLFGMLTFELFGQFVGSFDPADAFFDASVETMADLLGLAGAA